MSRYTKAMIKTAIFFALLFSAVCVFAEDRERDACLKLRNQPDRFDVTRRG